MVVNHKTKPADAVASEMIDRIIDCASWGAKPPTGPLEQSVGTTRKIILHHTGEPRHLTTDFSRDQAMKFARETQQFHQVERRWPDSGQHFTVSRGGYVLEGRLGSLETLKTGRAQMSAAHCPGRNQDSIGIENEGYYIEEIPTPKLWESLVQLCVTICRQYNIKAHNIFGHWDFRGTQCPGVAFYRQLPRLRREVAAVLGTQIGEIPERVWPDIHEVLTAGAMQQSGPVVTAAQYLLRNAGYDIALTDGGEWSAQMTPAIKDWQQKHGLAVSADGTMTAETWETLVPELGDGAHGEPVKALKNLLREKGYCREIVSVDDKFDAVTKHVVKDVQRLHGLPARDRVDIKSWCVITGGIVREAFKEP